VLSRFLQFFQAASSNYFKKCDAIISNHAEFEPDSGAMRSKRTYEWF
jgi:hypothetical protein